MLRAERDNRVGRLENITTFLSMYYSDYRQSLTSRIVVSAVGN
jgi:hypothetical protein